MTFQLDNSNVRVAVERTHFARDHVPSSLGLRERRSKRRSRYNERAERSNSKAEEVQRSRRRSSDQINGSDAQKTYNKYIKHSKMERTGVESSNGLQLGPSYECGDRQQSRRSKRRSRKHDACVLPVVAHVDRQSREARQLNSEPESRDIIQADLSDHLIQSNKATWASPHLCDRPPQAPGILNESRRKKFKKYTAAETLRCEPEKTHRNIDSSNQVVGISLRERIVKPDQLAPPFQPRALLNSGGYSDHAVNLHTLSKNESSGSPRTWWIFITKNAGRLRRKITDLRLFGPKLASPSHAIVDETTCSSSSKPHNPIKSGSRLLPGVPQDRGPLFINPLKLKHTSPSMELNSMSLASFDTFPRERRKSWFQRTISGSKFIEVF
ncbi:hypothetical protein E4T56_gene19435 [Termitomyces sp. T112]|nr:hypothetical protein E4T56_gene19435 [Termitomyces sp. T112]